MVQEVEMEVVAVEEVVMEVVAVEEKVGVVYRRRAVWIEHLQQTA